MEPSMQSKLLAEFLGTFLLIFTVECNAPSQMQGLVAILHVSHTLA